MPAEEIKAAHIMVIADDSIVPSLSVTLTMLGTAASICTIAIDRAPRISGGADAPPTCRGRAAAPLLTWFVAMLHGPAISMSEEIRPS